jgi:hypothetical protein
VSNPQEQRNSSDSISFRTREDFGGFWLFFIRTNNNREIIKGLNILRVWITILLGPDLCDPHKVLINLTVADIFDFFVYEDLDRDHWRLTNTNVSHEST